MSSANSSITKLLFRDLEEFISTWGSNLAFFDLWPFISFRSHILKIRSWRFHTSHVLKASWNQESYFPKPSDFVLSSIFFPSSSRHYSGNPGCSLGPFFCKASTYSWWKNLMRSIHDIFYLWSFSLLWSQASDLASSCVRPTYTLHSAYLKNRVRE